MDTKLKQEIIEVLNAEGLDKAEEMAVTATRTAFKIMRLIVPKINSYVAVMVMPLIEVIEPKILKSIDEIDGVDSPDY
jgi:hypothetical protein